MAKTNIFGENMEDDNGIGNYGYFIGDNGTPVGLSQDAYNSINATHVQGDGMHFGKINPVTAKTSWMGKGGYIDTASQGLAAAGSLLSGYTALKNLGLAKDKFNFEKGTTNRNILNQGTLVNNNMDNANNVGLALAGNTLTADQKAASRRATANRHVNVSSIG